MKKLLLLSLFIIPLTTNAQEHFVHSGLQFAEQSLGLGVGYAYGINDFGLYSNISFDLSHKANNPKLETGAGADLALAFRETDAVDNWAQINVGGMYQVTDGIWAVLAPGISIYQSFTQHRDEYWVHRDNYTRFNMSGGLLHSKAERMTVGLMGYTDPASVSFNIGIKFSTTSEDK